MAEEANTYGGFATGGPIQIFAAKPSVPRRPQIARAEGITMWDTAGRRYIDASSGPVVSNLGHGNPRVLGALIDQARRAVFATPSSFESEANIALAEKVTALAGPGFERAFPVSGGSEAIEACLKFCRSVAVHRGEPARWKVIGRMPSYHGNTLGAQAVTGDVVADEIFAPLMRTMPKVPAPFSYRVPEEYTPATYAAFCAEEVERTILAEGPETVLAVILEPVGGLATGALVAPADYYRRVREICTRYGVLLIYDEVMSGAGRTGRFLAADHWPEARPDIVALAKGIGAGYTPLGIMLAPKALADPLATAGGFQHGHTYNANPLSCAVGAAVLDEMIERDLIGNAARMGAALRARLDAIAADSPIVGDARGLGLLTAIEIVADKATKAMIPLDLLAPYRIVELAAERGLLLYCRRTSRGRYGDWIMIAPPLTVTEAELDEIADLLARSLAAYVDELARGGAAAAYAGRR